MVYVTVEAHIGTVIYEKKIAQRVYSPIVIWSSSVELDGGHMIDGIGGLICVVKAWARGPDHLACSLTVISLLVTHYCIGAVLLTCPCSVILFRVFVTHNAAGSQAVPP